MVTAGVVEILDKAPNRPHVFKAAVVGWFVFSSLMLATSTSLYLSGKRAKRQAFDKRLSAEKAALVTQGISVAAAETRAVAVVAEDLASRRGRGKQNMLIGGLWCAGGLIVTFLTFSVAAGGGTFIVLWGAMAVGGIQFVVGLIQYMNEISGSPKI